MNRLYRSIQKGMIGSLAGLLFFYTAFPPDLALAQPNHRISASKLQYGKVIKALPPGHRVVTVGKANYYYSNGFFYQTKGRKWVTVRPPVGAIVVSLTAAAVLVTVLGAPYYFYEGTYYKKIPAGYQVVEIEASPTTVPIAGQKVRVTAELLNMRSGPDKSHNVIHQIPEGTTLVIRGSSPDWLYVELDDGKIGWVMKAYTASVVVPARG